MATEPRLWNKLNSALRSLEPKLKPSVAAGGGPIADAIQCRCKHENCPIGCPKDCECQANWRDLIPGGLADNKTPSEFDPERLKEGQTVELEYTSNARLALEVAMDHLTENPEYYTKLAEMEATGNSLSDAAEADKLLGSGYNKLLGVKGFFDAWEEIYPEAMKVYNQALKAIDSAANARAEAHQLRMMVQKFSNRS